MKAIEFQLNVTKLLDIRFGDSEFKKVDDFWYDFRPEGGDKTTTFCPNLIKDTPTNRELVQSLQRHYFKVKAANDAFDKEMYQIRNQFEK